MNIQAQQNNMYEAEEAEIAALKEVTTLFERDTQDFAARVAAIRLKHHKLRTWEQ